MIGVTKYFKSSLIQNTFFSLINKGINAFVPLFFIPLCSNLFGIEAFGRMIFYQSLVGLLITFSDYGFSVTGLKAASLNSNNPIAISKLFSEISFIKVSLLLLGSISLYIYISSTDSELANTNELLLFLFVLGSLSLQSLLPYWLFQGLRKNKIVAIINLISKLLLILLTVLFVLKSKFIFSVALVELISYVFALSICLVLLYKKYKIKLQFPKVNAMKNQLYVGFNVFIIVLIYWAINGGSILFVEKNVTAFELGFYGIFLRFSYYTFAIFQPIILSFIPFFTEKFNESFSAGINYFKKIFLYYTVSVFVLLFILGLLLKSIVEVTFSNEIILFFRSNQLIPYSLLFWIFLILINSFTANTVLLSANKESTYRNAQLLNGISVLSFFYIHPKIAGPWSRF